MTVALSHHAMRRCQARGITGETLDMLLSHADVEVPVGGGAWALSVSSAARRRLLDEGSGAQKVDRLKRLVAIVADEAIVTVLHAYGRRGRAYHRGRK